MKIVNIKILKKKISNNKIIIIINKREMKTFTIDVDDMTSKMDILENN